MPPVWVGGGIKDSREDYKELIRLYNRNQTIVVIHCTGLFKHKYQQGQASI